MAPSARKIGRRVKPKPKKAKTKTKKVVKRAKPKAKPKKVVKKAKPAAKTTPTKKVRQRGTVSKFCVESGCREKADTKGFCRLHYISNWKKLRLSDQIKAEKRLNSYVDKLVKKFPGEYLDRIKEGLEDEEKFKETVQELSVGESSSNANQTPSEENEETEENFLEKFTRDLKLDE